MLNSKLFMNSFALERQLIPLTTLRESKSISSSSLEIAYQNFGWRLTFPTLGMAYRLEAGFSNGRDGVSKILSVILGVEEKARIKIRSPSCLRIWYQNFRWKLASLTVGMAYPNFDPPSWG
jgi:hypothetical protein